MRNWSILVTLWFAVGCSFDAGGASPREDGGAAPPADARAGDAALPDASGVECTVDDDCATPPGPCQLAGSCDLATNTCSYPGKDCSGIADDCNEGVCEPATGACVALPVSEGAACGAVETCTEFDTCGGFDGDDVCDETGMRSRTCMVFACAKGSCLGTQRVDTESCERDRDGVICADTTCTDFGPCGRFSGACDESGTRQRTCTAFACSDAACVAQAFVDSEPCERPSTDGEVCASDDCPAFSECGGFLGVCDQTGQRSRFCTRFRCDDEVCEAESFSQTQACMRDTDGMVCGHIEDEVCTELGECPGLCTGICQKNCFQVFCSDGACPPSEPGACP